MRPRSKPPKPGLGRLLRQYREARNWTQTVVGEDAGIGQGALARIELGECMPRTDTLSRIIVALQLSQSELGVLMTEIFSAFQPIDWPSRLQIDAFSVCKERARGCLDRGQVRDAYGYIQAMLQLAKAPDEHCDAHMLQGVQYKAQALFGLAERSFMEALEHARLSKGTSRQQVGVWLNLVDLHLDACHFAAAEGYLELVDRRNPVEEEMFFFKLHSARLGLLGGLPNARESALLLFAEARDLFRGLEEARPNGSTNADWAEALRAEVLGTHA